MKIQFVGVGNAFASKASGFYQTNALIHSRSGKKLMIDCGSLAPHALEDFGITAQNIGDEIDAFYVSHLHADHIGGLEYVALSTFFNPKFKRPQLYVHEVIEKELWDQSLRGGLHTLQGLKPATLRSYFAVHAVKDNESFVWEDIQFCPIQMVHVLSGTIFMPSYGLMIQEGDVLPKSAQEMENSGPGTPNYNFKPHGQKVFFTSDTQFAPHQIEDFYNIADVIFQDCETTPFKSKVHAHYNDLKTLSDEVKAKMWLTHYHTMEGFDATGDGFLGFVERSKMYEFNSWNK